MAPDADNGPSMYTHHVFLCHVPVHRDRTLPDKPARLTHRDADVI
jgi:hypothetical protein